MDELKNKFMTLPLALQYKLIEEKGIYITYRNYKTYKIELFRLGGFYIEVWRTGAINEVIHTIFQSETNVHNNYFSDKWVSEIDQALNT